MLLAGSTRLLRSIGAAEAARPGIERFLRDFRSLTSLKLVRRRTTGRLYQSYLQLAVNERSTVLEKTQNPVLTFATLV